MMKKFFVAVVLVLYVTNCLVVSGRVISRKPLKEVMPVCPSRELILPCTCLADFQILLCQGQTITQSAITNAVAALRESNNVPPTGNLTWDQVYIFYTNLVVLDLSPLLNMNIFDLSISGNTNLQQLSGPNSPNGLINAQSLTIYNNGITNLGIHDLATYFSQGTQYLDLSFNKLVGRPPLLHFNNIRYLDLSGNQITKLNSGDFKYFTKLTDLSLYYTGLEELGPNSLSIDQPNDEHIARRNVNLEMNILTDDRIDANTGLQSPENGWSLNLRYNEFEYLSAQKFQIYLEAVTLNSLRFANEDGIGQNQFICDQRMKWLKDAAAVDPTLESRVVGVFCTNDPGETIFTTDLV